MLSYENDFCQSYEERKKICSKAYQAGGGILEIEDNI